MGPPRIGPLLALPPSGWPVSRQLTFTPSGTRMFARTFLALGALSGAIAVGLGAAASHALADRLVNTEAWFRTALHYQEFHSLALVLVGVLAATRPSRLLAVAGGLLASGIVLFCGNLYLRSILHFHDWHALTPIGGSAFIIGWLAMAVAAMSSPRADKA